MKILIIRFSSIGDIVLTTPVIRGIKTQLNAEVHFATKVKFLNIVASNPHVDKVHGLENDLLQFIRVLKREKFDCIIDLHHNLRTAIIKTFLGIRSYSFDKLNVAKWWMVNFKINRLPERHIVDRYMDTVRALGVKDDLLGLDYFIPDNDKISMTSLPETHRNGYVAYAIGGQHYTKKLPLNRMIELCAKISRPIILLGGQEDAALGEKVRLFFEQKKDSGVIIYNACGRYNLNQSASVIASAQYVFSHDTGLMHIAAAFQKNIFSIWGNTIPAFGMYPYRTIFTNLENNNLDCRPCSKIGYDHCPRGHFKCMREMEFNFQLPADPA